MTFQETLKTVTSFASLMLSRERVRKIVSDTGEQYIGKLVIETAPNGTQQEAMIMKIEWCDSCGLNGDWLLYITYTDEKSPVPGAWVNRDALSLVDGQ